MDKVEIVIPVHNRRDTTLQCLKSLSRINKNRLSVHIIVVDDGSTDGTSEAIGKQFPNVEIVKGSGNLHYAAGTNLGILAALEKDPDFIVTMNDDAIYHEQFLQHLLKTAKENPSSVVGSLLLLWDEPHKVFQVDFKWKTFSGGWFQKQSQTAFDLPREAFEVEGLAGNCILFPVKSILECGLMDEEKFPHGWGDIQWVVRMRKKGWKLLLEPKSLVWCEPNTNPESLHKQNFSSILNILVKNRKHPLNLQRQFIARWESAPSKPKAVISYLVYLTKLFGKSLKLVLTK